MLQTLLTVMLFIMPFLLSQREIPRPGLHTGLWISLFFWGRIHAMLSILVFGVSVVYYSFTTVQTGTSSRTVVTTVSSQATWIPRAGARPLTGFLAILIIFCAFGNVCQDYGAAMALPSVIQKTALALGFAGSLTGPVGFGALSDKTGPFAAFMLLLGLGLTAIFFTTLSSSFPYLFPFSALIMQAVIGGIFTLMPQLLLRFYGRAQLSFVLPLLLIFLAGLWTMALKFYDDTDALPQDYLLSMVFLLLMAAPLAIRAWNHRFTVL